MAAYTYSAINAQGMELAGEIHAPDFTAGPRFPYELDPLQLSRLEMADYARKAAWAGMAASVLASRWSGTADGMPRPGFHSRARARTSGLTDVS